MAGDGHIFPILLVLLRVYPHHNDHTDVETDEFNQGKLPFHIRLQITNIFSTVGYRFCSFNTFDLCGYNRLRLFSVYNFKPHKRGTRKLKNIHIYIRKAFRGS